MSFCKKCGSELEAGQSFCPQCGEPANSYDNRIKTGKTTYKDDISKIISSFLTFKRVSIGIAAFIIILWGYGFIKGYSDIENQVSLITNEQVIGRLNPISANGYKTYLYHFTNYKEKKLELQELLDDF